MKKYFAILLGVLFLFACQRGEPVSGSNIYRKRADGIYFDLGIIYGAKRLDVDEDSFEVLEGWHAKDKDQVFFKGRYICNADPATFEVLGEYYGKDKSHVFYWNDLIAGANPATFKVLTLFTGRDDKHVFYMDRMVVGADPDSFYIKEKEVPSNEDGVLMDKDHVFVFDERNNKYYPSTLNLDRNTVEYVAGAWLPLLKDKNGVYWRNEKLPVDVQSFHEDDRDPLCCWKDKKEKYCRPCDGEVEWIFDTKGNVWK